MKNKKEISTNIPDPDLPPVKEDFKKTFPWRIFKIMAEFIEGFEFISTIGKKSATFFGGTRVGEKEEDYIRARKLGEILSKSGYTVISGGGPGIMEAANRGAHDAKGESVGINIELPEGQRANPFINKSVSFYYFFTRKVMMSLASSVYVFFPGGYGTLDEFFEMVVLLQTKKISNPITVVAVGRDFWQPIYDWLEQEVYEKRGAIDKKDLLIFKVVDTPEEAYKYIKLNENKIKNKK